MFELDLNQVIAAIVAAILAIVAGLENRHAAKATQYGKDVQDFFDPESPKVDIPAGTPGRSYKMDQETITKILAGKSAEDQARIMNQITSAESRMDATGKYECYTIVYSGGYYVIDYGIVIDHVSDDTVVGSFAHTPSGYVTPTTATIDSGEPITMEISYSPNSGAFGVKTIEVDFGDGTPVEVIRTESGRTKAYVTHIYEWERHPEDKHTSKAFYPTFTLIGGTGQTVSLSRKVIIHVNEKK